MLPKNLDLETIKDFTRGWFTNNKRYKIIALIIALAAWTYVMINSSSKVTIDVKLNISVVSDENLVAVGEIGDISLTLWGPTDAVRSLGRNQVRAFLEINNPEKGEKVFYLTSRNVYIPDRSVSVLDITPKKVTLTFQKLK